MNEFTEFLKEVFELFGPIQARRMFGGYGIYYEGLMFGLVADDVLYLKGDDENAYFFEDEGLGKFEYAKKGKIAYIAYYQAPDIIMDDREEAALWARRSWLAAVRADEKKRSKRKPAG